MYTTNQYTSIIFNIPLYTLVGSVFQVMIKKTQAKTLTFAIVEKLCKSRACAGTKVVKNGLRRSKEELKIMLVVQNLWVSRG